MIEIDGVKMMKRIGPKRCPQALLQNDGVIDGVECS
jgi:hypothetical protein